MDTSSHDRTASQLFKLILENGPLTLYAANATSDIPIGTIHRHFKEMTDAEKIKIYDHGKSGRRKISYGPTLYGLIYFYRIDKDIEKKLENYFDVWIKREQFVAELKDAGFDEKKLGTDLKMSKKIFRKYIQYYAGVEEQLLNFARNMNELPRDVRMFLGEFLVATKSDYKKLWEELYLSLPGFRKNVTDFFEEMIKFYSELKKKR
ncbi:MAG: ArsR family transcriptional regulator [Nitrosopumilaceae archaeon]